MERVVITTTSPQYITGRLMLRERTVKLCCAQMMRHFNSLFTDGYIVQMIFTCRDGDPHQRPLFVMLFMSAKEEAPMSRWRRIVRR